MSTLLHLNGPPGIGKSTLARRWAAEHPGTLCCDIDVLRTFIGGWREDFPRAGGLVRPAARALVTAYLEHSGDVVLPQLLADPAELDAFEAAVHAVGARWVEVVLVDAADDAVARFARRGAAGEAWHDEVRAIVRAHGGERLLRDYVGQLEELVRARPDAVVVVSTEGDPRATYAALTEAVRRAG